MKWGDVINATIKANPDFMSSECNDIGWAKSSLGFMTQDELWSHHDDDDSRIRYVVAQRIKDQDRLWEMRNDKDSTVSNMVARRIKSQGRLVQMAVAQTSFAVRVTAVKRIKGKDDTLEVLMSPTSPVGSMPVGLLIDKLAGDRDKLKEVISLVKNPLIRVRAAIALGDQEILWGLRNDLHCSEEYYAVTGFAEHIEGDDRILEFIRIAAVKYSSQRAAISCIAVERISSQDRLLEMRASETEPRVAMAIDARLHELGLTAKEDTI